MVQPVALPDGNLINFPDEMSPDDIQKAMPHAYAQYMASNTPPSDAIRAGYQGIMNTVAKPINTAVNNTMGAVAQTEAPAAQGIANAMDFTGAAPFTSGGQGIGDMLMNAKNALSSGAGKTQDWIANQSNVDTAATPSKADFLLNAIGKPGGLQSYNSDLGKDTAALGQNAQLAGNFTAAKAPLEELEGGLGKSLSLKNIPDNFDGPGGGGGSGPWLPPQTAKTPYATSDTQQALSQMHSIVKAHDSDLYNWRDQMAQGKQQDVGDFKDTLGAVIDDAKSRVANPSAENSAVKKLENIHSQISDDGSMPLDQLTQLDRYFNSLPKSAYTDSPINGTARGLVKGAIEQAAQTYPEFGDAHYAANEFHGNFKNEFENDVMNPIWNPDDTNNLNMYANGKTRVVNPETKSRAENFMDNVNNGGITAYNQVKSLLPDAESQNAFANEFKNYIIKNDGNSRWNALKTLISDPFTNTGRKIFDLGYPQYNAETKGFLSAERGNAPYNYGDDAAPFNSYLDDSMHRLNDMKSTQMDAESDAALSRMNQPAPQLALPAPAIRMPETQSGLYKQIPNSIDTTRPEFPLVQDPTDGTVRHMTQDEAHDYIQAGQSGGDDLSRGLKMAQAQRANSIEAERLNKAKQAYAQNPANASNLGRESGNSAMGIGPERQAVRDRDAALLEGERTPTIQQMALEDRHPEDVGDVGAALLRSVRGFKRGGAIQPTEAQKHAGNYAKDHIKVHGLDISIENPRGSIRSGKDKNGEEWSVKMECPYGYIRGTAGADNDHVDCYIGPNKHSLRVYVIDQKHPDGGGFDEHKCMLSFPDRESAITAYKASFSDGKGSKRIMHVKKMLMPEFKEWLKSGNTKKPIGKTT